MAHYEAVVTSLLPNGKAEILIQPDRTGSPGAPACHCAANNTLFRIKALNSADALVGDWVSVSRDSTNTMKNVGVLGGIPLAGFISGVALGSFWGGNALIISSFTGTLLSIGVAVLFYRRMSAMNLPVIERVIQSRKELAAMHANRSITEKDSTGCQGGRKGAPPASRSHSEHHMSCDYDFSLPLLIFKMNSTLTICWLIGISANRRLRA